MGYRGLWSVSYLKLGTRKRKGDPGGPLTGKTKGPQALPQAPPRRLKQQREEGEPGRFRLLPALVLEAQEDPGDAQKGPPWEPKRPHKSAPES